jgi:hypothetical protein
MKMTICNNGNGLMQVGIDGAFYDDLDASLLDTDIHAVQWKDTYGWIERKDPLTDRMVSNEDIDSMDQFQFAVEAWDVAYQAEQDALAAEPEPASNESGGEQAPQ